MNFDGAFDHQSGKAQIGGLARDQNGNLLMAFTGELVRASHLLGVELLALQRGLHHLSSLPQSAVQLEGDCLVLITSIRESGYLSWDLMPMWKQTMDMLSSYAQWTIHYCKRSANRVADMLAHYEMPGDAADLAALPPHIKLQFDEEKENAPGIHQFFFPPSSRGGGQC